MTIHHIFRHPLASPFIWLALALVLVVHAFASPVTRAQVRKCGSMAYQRLHPTVGDGYVKIVKGHVHVFCGTAIPKGAERDRLLKWGRAYNAAHKH